MATPPYLIDSHCHFDDPRLDSDRDHAYRRAADVGVCAMIVPGVSATQWRRQKEIVNRYSGLHSSYGLHPMFLDQHRPEHVDELATWLERERCVAVGECGLDFFLPHLDQNAQTELFVAQLRLAKIFDLPVIIHARRAVDQVTKCLRRFPGLGGVVHSFAGSQQQAQTLVAMGFKLGLGGAVTWPRAQRLRRLAATQPIEDILLETDAPDQTGAGHRGERNEPSYLPEVLDVVAELRHAAVEDIAAAANDNAKQLFGI
jgi:TatD DNase family protein